MITRAISPRASVAGAALNTLVIFVVAALPGYALAALTIDKIGRRRMQATGFAVMAAAFAGLWLIPGATRMLVPFLLLFGATYFFAEFGPNTTTFVYPAEIFPVRVTRAQRRQPGSPHRDRRSRPADVAGAASTPGLPARDRVASGATMWESEEDDGLPRTGRGVGRRARQGGPAMRRAPPVTCDRPVPEQVRVGRLFAWLEDIGRFRGGEAMLSSAWARLAGLLDAAARDDPGMHAALGAVRQHDLGCAAWWEAVRAARHACEARAGSQRVCAGRPRVMARADR